MNILSTLVHVCVHSSRRPYPIVHDFERCMVSIQSLFRRLPMTLSVMVIYIELVVHWFIIRDIAIAKCGRLSVSSHPITPWVDVSTPFMVRQRAQSACNGPRSSATLVNPHEQCIATANEVRMSFQHFIASVASGEAYDFFIVARGACLCYDDARLARALQRVASGKESGLRLQLLYTIREGSRARKRTLVHCNKRFETLIAPLWGQRHLPAGVMGCGRDAKSCTVLQLQIHE